MKVYRLSWEMVGVRDMWRFSNADPAMYENTTQLVPNSEIPDGYWRPISKESGDPFSQYNQLKRWADADTEFVRNVRLEEADSEPVAWREVVR